MRIGVGKPPSAQQGASHVLRRPPRACGNCSRSQCETAADAVERIAADGIDAAMRGATRCRASTDASAARPTITADRGRQPVRRPAPAARRPGAGRAAGCGRCHRRRARVGAGASRPPAWPRSPSGAPLLVVTPTGLDAERLADDLDLPARAGRGPAGARGRHVGALSGAVTVLPAWETLPFERVSPEIETMGRRLAVIHALRQSAAASCRTPGSSSARCGRPAAPRATRGGGRRRDRARPAGRLGVPAARAGGAAGTGASTRSSTAGSSPCAAASSTSSRPPRTSPVRIDLWGDEVDRLTTFAVSDQRSSRDIDTVILYGCRELTARHGCAVTRHGALKARRPWGASIWERLERGEQFDGMESWLPFLDGDATRAARPAAAGAQVVLVEPRRIRDRAVQLLDEEAALAETLAATWGAKEGDEDPFPRLARALRAAPARLRRRGRLAPAGARGPVDGGAPGRALRAGGGRPGASGRRGHPAGGRRLRGDAVRRHRPGRGAALGARWPSRVCTRRCSTPRPPRPGAVVVAAPVTSGFVLPDAKVAVLSETDVTGRRMPHRRARPRARAADGFFDDLEAGSFVVHRQHGVARFEGVTTRTMGGHDPRLPDPAVPRLGPPVPPGRADRGDHPVLGRRVADAVEDGRRRLAAHAGARRGRPPARWPPSWSSSTGAAWPSRATPSAPDTPWQAEMESSFGFVETEDQLKAIADVKADMEEPRPMDRLVCGDVGFGKTEVAVRAVFKAVQDGTQAAILVPTTLLASQHAQTFAERYAPYPVRVELLSRFLSPAQQREVVQGLADGSVDVVIGTHRLLAQDVQFKQLGPAGRGRGAALRGHAQGGGEAHRRGRRRADADRQPDPAHPGDGAHGHPGPVDGQHAAGRPPPDPHLRRRARHARRSARRSAASSCARARCSTCTTGCRTSTAWRATCATSCPRRAWPSPTGRWTRAASRRWCSTSGSSATTSSSARRSSSRASTCPRSTRLIVDRADLLGLGQLHQIRGRVGRGGQRAYAYLFHPADRVLSEQAYERLRTIGEHTELGSGFKIAMRDLEIRGAGNLLGLGPVGAHRRRGLRPLRAAGGRGGGRGAGRGAARRRRRSRSTSPATRTCRRTTWRPRTPASRRTAGWPPRRRSTTSTTSAPSGPTVTARCRRRPRGCSPSAACVPARWRVASARSR